MISIDFEPIVKVLSKKYLCSNKFLIDPLLDSLNLFDDTYELILISGNETQLFS